MDEYNDKPQFEVAERSELPAIIKVIGVGGGGGNAVENMFRTGIKDVSFVLCNTDKQAMRGTNRQRRDIDRGVPPFFSYPLTAAAKLLSRDV